MTDHAHDLAVDRILSARRDRTPLQTLPVESRPADTAAGYDLQDAVHARLERDGAGTRAGWKIGCTNKLMQDMLGIPHPAAGAVMARDLVNSPAILSFSRFVAPGVECEVAVRLGADLSPDEAPFTSDSVASRVAACMAAIEVVDNRYADFRAVGTPTLIGDDFFQAAAVVGVAVTDTASLDLAAVQAVIRIDGVETGRGRGSDVMGHPYEALAWLANAWAQRGRGLKAGELVLTGTMVAVQWLERPARAEIEISGLGAAAITFEAD